MLVISFSAHTKLESLHTMFRSSLTGQKASVEAEYQITVLSINDINISETIIAENEITCIHIIIFSLWSYRTSKTENMELLLVPLMKR